MPVYVVSLILKGSDLTDDMLEALFARIEDVVPSSVNGAVKVTAPLEAPDDQTAALLLIKAVERALPDSSVIRLDQDLVSITDIAERTNRSRESVRLLVDAKRGPGQFPTPIGTVGDGIRIWPWATVVTWFREMLTEDIGEHLAVSAATAALIDASLSGRVQLGLAQSPKRRVPA